MTDVSPAEQGSVAPTLAILASPHVMVVTVSGGRGWPERLMRDLVAMPPGDRVVVVWEGRWRRSVRRHARWVGQPRVNTVGAVLRSSGYDKVVPYVSWPSARVTRVMSLNEDSGTRRWAQKVGILGGGRGSMTLRALSRSRFASPVVAALHGSAVVAWRGGQ